MGREHSNCKVECHRSVCQERAVGLTETNRSDGGQVFLMCGLR
jgi:hypothetical protein